MTDTDAMTRATMDVILTYWQTWQDQNWTRLRSVLADELTFGGQTMPRDQFVQFCQQGTPWDDVQLLDSMFTHEGGTLLYEGTDRETGDRIRVAELVRVKGGRVYSTNACFGTGVPPQPKPA